MVTVVMQPGGETVTFPRLNTVTQLLGKLKLKPTEVLVIRGRELLTVDRRLGPEDQLIVRSVISRG